MADQHGGRASRHRGLPSPRALVLLAVATSLVDAVVRMRAAAFEGPLALGVAVVAAAAVAVWFAPARRVAVLAPALAAGVVAGLNLAWLVAGRDVLVSAVVLAGLTALLLAAAAVGAAGTAHRDRTTTGSGRRWDWLVGLGAAVGAVALTAVVGAGALAQSVHRQLYDDRLVAADYWSEDLVILSAGLGFDGIIGVPDDEFDTVREAGGTYLADPDCTEADGPLVSTTLSASIPRLYRGEAAFDDGLPIVTSWPVLGSTLHPEDFLFTLNTGATVVPHAVGLYPNWELNERNTVVAFGDFGNRGRAGEVGAIFPVALEIVDDGTPLTFMGPEGPRSGVGLVWRDGGSPYDAGPRLVGAKLNRIGEGSEGEGGVGALEGSLLPNDEFALYGGGDFRLRMLTTGGFSPDGLTGITPDQFADFFRIHATGPDGEVVLLDEVGVDYALAGGTLRVVGLADLGQRSTDSPFDDCYVEDRDNYIDVILVGDEAAARGVTHLEIPAADGYSPLFNPGGPGPTPFPEVRYTAPGPRDLEPVIVALDDPLRVDA